MKRFLRITGAAVLVLAILVTGAVSISASSNTAPAQAGAAETFVVLYKGNSVPSSVAGDITAAGGQLVYVYDKIGVAIAASDIATFRANLLKDTRIEGASSTARFGVRLDEELEVVDAAAVATNGAWGDPLSVSQWDMRQIHVPEAHAITAGSPSVVVGDIDTGLDYTHPDLAANVDFANSVSCVGGVPNQDPAAWMDDNGHGTHTAGTIAAAANGIGIVGVAPNVKIAGIKAGNADGYFFPEAVICSFMWAGSHQHRRDQQQLLRRSRGSSTAGTTRNSARSGRPSSGRFAGRCRRAWWWLQPRAMKTSTYPSGTSTRISPDFPPGSALEREVTNACVVIPVEISGVVGVTANGAMLQKSYYSTYGVGVAQVTAPGGDRRFQDPGDGSRGYVLSTFPGNRYALAQGTSMASPHAAGVAALIRSQHPNLPAGAVQAALTSTADPLACPPNPFNPGPPYSFAATCVGGEGYNGFYGHGQVNALSAVLH